MQMPQGYGACKEAGGAAALHRVRQAGPAGDNEVRACRSGSLAGQEMRKEETGVSKGAVM